MVISAITENETANSSFLSVNELNITVTYKEHYRERCYMVIDTNNIGDITVLIKDEFLLINNTRSVLPLVGRISIFILRLKEVSQREVSIIINISICSNASDFIEYMKLNII